MPEPFSVPTKVYHIVGVGPTLITRPGPADTGIVKTVRGGVGIDTDFTQEGPPDSGTSAELVLMGDLGSFRIKPGNWVPQTFAPGDVGVAGNTITITSHGFLDIQGPFRLSSDTTLPAGISAATDYWLIKVDTDTFKIATSLANALAGIDVDITDAGTGTHTITGMHNVAIAPVASIADGTGAFLLLVGQSAVVTPARHVSVLGGSATDTLSYFWR